MPCRSVHMQVHKQMSSEAAYLTSCRESRRKKLTIAQTRAKDLRDFDTAQLPMVGFQEKNLCTLVMFRHLPPGLRSQRLVTGDKFDSHQTASTTRPVQVFELQFKAGLAGLELEPTRRAASLDIAWQPEIASLESIHVILQR